MVVKLVGLGSWVVAGVFLGACASADGDLDSGAVGGGDGGDPTTDAPPGGGSDAADPANRIDGSVSTGRECPANQFATGFDPDGGLVCSSLADATRATLNQNCSLYWGWRDSCDSCVTEPSKWGRVSGDSCANGTGADNTCTTPTLGADVVQLFGLSPDGDVGDDDKFYLGLHCVDGVNTGTIVPCLPGQFLTRVEGTPVCRSAAVAISKYAQQHCSLYMGWRDNCDGCTTPPAKWGRVTETACQVGAGTDNTCSAHDLGGVDVDTFGLNPDGDVDGNDKFYLGISCAAPPANSMNVAGTCPDGMLVSAINTDGSAVCTDPAPSIAALVRQGCYAYLGWRDNCDGCTNIPAKWGRTSTNTCQLGAGSDGTCSPATLDGVEVQLVGVNTDGDSNGDDKYYAGFRCF